MPLAIDRRRFLQNTLLATAGTAVAGPAILANSARAIEPIPRNGKAKFKFSLAAYSYRELLTGPRKRLTLEDFVVDYAKMQLDGTELTSYYFPEPLTNEYLCKIKQLAFRLGLDISGTATRNEFCFPPGKERDDQIAYTKKWIDHAAVLGAPVIRIFSGTQRPGQSPEDAHKLAVAGMEECCQYAGEHGVHLALENHGGLTTRVEEMLALVRDVKSPWFAVNLDTGNFHGEDIYGDLAKIAPYAMNVQVKVMISGPDKKKKPSDFKQLAKIMSDAGYRGYIVLEYEEPPDPLVACPKFIDEIRAAFA